MSNKPSNTNNKKQNNSMFIYTALIFVVALILIILAFFGQTNLSNLRKSTENISTEQTATISPQITEEAKTMPPNTDELARLTNSLSALKSENEELASRIETYESLLAANGYISVGNNEEALSILNEIDDSALTDDQKILYDQIITTINKGEEQ